jgi:hypothetical protein
MNERTCSFSNCSKPYYAKGYCRNHYRKISGEGKRYWQKVKIEKPEMLIEARERSRKYWYEVGRYDPVRRKKHNKRQLEYYHDSTTGRKQYLKKWKLNLPVDKKRIYYKRDNDTRYFGDYRVVQRVLELAENKCSVCGISNEKHWEKYGSRLTIHHIDGNGRGKSKNNKNNDPNNFQVLCKSCHMKIEQRTK